MARRFLVQTDFTAKNNMSPTIKRINKDYGRFAANITDKNSMVGRSFGGVNKVINRVAMVGMVALIAGAGIAAREFVKLDHFITSAGAKFKDIDSTSITFQDNLDKLSEAARAVGADTEFAATDAAGALDKFAMSGLRSDQAMALLRGTTDLATAAGTDLTTAVDIATDSLGAFNLEIDTTEQAQMSLARVSDVMAKTTTTANTSLQDMFEAIKAGAPAFTSAGQELETFAAFTGVLANAGIKGAQSGTSLRNVMLRLAKPTGEAADVLEKLGVTTADADGNFRDAIDILGDMEKGLQGMGTQQRTAALATVFGAKTVTGINILLAEGSDALRTYRGDLINSTGAASNMAKAMRTSLSSQIAILKSGLIEIGLRFVEAFESDGRGALQGLIEAVQALDITPLIKFAKLIVGIITFIGKHWKILISLAVGIKAVAAAMVIMNIITAVFGKTLEATPIGKIIVILFLLAAAITFVVLNWDKITAAVKWFWGVIVKAAIAVNNFAIFLAQKLVQGLKAAWNWIANVGQKFTFILGPIGMLITSLIEIIKQWDNIKSAFQDGGFLSGIMAIGDAILAGLLAPLQGVLELASKVPGLGRLAEGGAQKIAEIRAGLGGSGNTIGTPGTPTPFTGTPGSLNSTIDVNFNNKPENVDIVGGRKAATGVNVNIAPAFSP